MKIENGELSFFVNTTNLGVAFKDSSLTEAGLFPFLFMHSNEDWIEVLSGSLNST